MAGGLRATVRLARRDAWRNKGRSALIALMVALPVLVLSVVSVLTRSSEFEPRDDIAVALGDRAQASIAAVLPGVPIVQAPRAYGYFSEAELAGMGSDGSSTQKQPDPKQLAPGELQAQMESLVPAGDRLLIDNRGYADRVLRFGDRALSAELREFDYTAPGAEGMVTQESGRAPQADDEVVVTASMAKDEAITIGDQLQDTREDARTPNLTVVGIVGGLAQADYPQIIGRPGQLIGAYEPGMGAATWIVTGTTSFDWDQVLAANRLGFQVTSRSVMLDPPAAALETEQRLRDYLSYSSTDLNAVAIGGVVIGLVLLQLALLAGPAIAVGARRNERTLALVSANGGLPRQLRGIVLATSTVIGLVACAVAAVLGVAIGAVLVIVLRERFFQVLPRVDIHPLDMVALVAVGTLTAAGAALVPARLAARLNVIATLTGRRGQAAPARRVPIIGLLIAAAGAACTFYGVTQRQELLTVGGIAIAEIGLVTATGAIIALVARLGRFMPFTGRFALRDAARQRGRTAPAVAAVMAAIAGSVAAGAYLASQDGYFEQTFQPSMALGAVSYSFPASGEPEAEDLATLAPAAEAVLRRTLPIKDLITVLGPPQSDKQSTEIGMRLAPGRTCPTDSTYDIKLEPKGNFCFAGGSGLYQSGFTTAMFGDGTLVETYTGVAQPEASAALKAGRAVTFSRQFLWPDGTIHAGVVTRDQNGEPTAKRTVKVPAVFVSTTPGLSGPVFPVSAARTLGVTLQPSGLLASTTRMPTSDEENRAIAALDAVGPPYVFVQRPYQSDIGLVLLALVGGCAAITLVGTLTAVGLAKTEGAADVATLAAIGASPGVRRRLSAAQAGVITILGALLGLVTGLLVGWALVRLAGDSFATEDMGVEPQIDSWPFVVPWWPVLGAVVGVPLLAMAMSFAVTRSRLPMVRRLGQ